MPPTQLLVWVTFKARCACLSPPIARNSAPTHARRFRRALTADRIEGVGHRDCRGPSIRRDVSHLGKWPPARRRCPYLSCALLKFMAHDELGRRNREEFHVVFKATPPHPVARFHENVRFLSASLCRSLTQLSIFARFQTRRSSRSARPQLSRVGRHWQTPCNVTFSCG